jgi:hypothetical protein
VTRKTSLKNKRVYIRRRPVHEWIDLETAVGLLKNRQLRAPAAVTALAPGDPGCNTLKRRPERGDLANLAA